MDIYWLWLTEVRGVGSVTQRNLVKALGSPHAVYAASEEELRAIRGLRGQVVQTILASRSMEGAKQAEENLQRHGISLLSFVDPLYPPRANSFPNIPAVVYYKGQLHLPQASVGVVGSRRCTAYGKQVSANVATFLAQHGITVASGLAKGIDSYAHTACLKEGGYTLAFVANGLDICYPPEHRSLMDKILENGAVLSPYSPGTRPRQAYFPLRNRLLSAWVDHLLVVEAGERSGALSTAGYALEQNQRVFTVPNSIYSPESFGTNRLLQRGAEVYLDPRQLLDFRQAPAEPVTFNPPTPIKEGFLHKKPEEPISPQEQLILDRLNNHVSPVEIRDCLDLFDGNLGKLLSYLCSMELEGKVMVTGQTVLLRINI